MKTITYNKLVRDMIPEIIEASGKKVVCETLNEEDYLKLLKQKLLEELNEFLESDDVAELADMGEVMHALLEYKGVSIETFQRIRQEKLEKRGGFKKRLLLKEVIEEQKKTLYAPPASVFFTWAGGLLFLKLINNYY